MRDEVSREIVVVAAVERVWSALTDAVEVAQWFGDTASIDLRVGGAVEFSWAPGEVSKGVVTTVDPMSAFGYRWDVFGSVVDPGAFTQVEFWLRPAESGTAVRVVETGLHRLVEAEVAPDLEELLEEHIDGWRNEMGDLARYLQRPRPSAATRHRPPTATATDRSA